MWNSVTFTHITSMRMRNTFRTLRCTLRGQLMTFLSANRIYIRLLQQRDNEWHFCQVQRLLRSPRNTYAVAFAVCRESRRSHHTLQWVWCDLIRGLVTRLSRSPLVLRTGLYTGTSQKGNLCCLTLDERLILCVKFVWLVKKTINSADDVFGRFMVHFITWNHLVDTSDSAQRIKHGTFICACM